MVTEPVLHSSDEAFAFITELRKLVRWLGICDGNMEEGSLRCDANVSIRPQGQTTLGTKVEVKNLNSIRNVKRAIEAEVRRQAALLDAGQKVVQQTRGYNADRDTTLPQRDKEEANDYRYLPCPDLPPFTVSRNWMQEITASMPSLPEKVFAHYTTALQLPAYDAQVLTEERGMSRYFGELITHTGHYKAAANWMLGPVKNWLNEQHADIGQFPLKPAALASVIELVQSDKVNFSMAATRLLPKLLEQPEASAAQLAAKLGIVQNHDAGELEKWVDEALAAMPDKVKEYQKGKKGLIGLFVGEVKKRSKGKADPKITTQMLEQKLKIS
jgi:aspartyl-tRNA(Asn)/glutamyl-tRNA(Gln) amidotransferase subunit B